MDKDFMLKNGTAKHLFHAFAEEMPIIDYHCHIPAREIYEDRRYNNISEIWLGGRCADGTWFGDHYKWRIMRSAGIPEKNITGNADPYDKFFAFAGALELAIGNPIYHWSNDELHRYFGVTEPLTMDNAKEIWDKTSDMLQNDPNLTARGIIRQSNVKYIGTTDDPVDSLKWHEKLAEIPDLGFIVRPSFRPDRAINIDKVGWREYVNRLGTCVGRKLRTAQDVCDALNERIDFFKAHGCVASDHGIDYIMFREGTDAQADEAFRKAMEGKRLTREEIEIFQTRIILSLARKYRRENIVMELHYSCTRNNNARMYRIEGPDTGFDMIAKSACGNQMAQLFSCLDETDELPRTIVFSLDHNDFNQIMTCLGCFQSDEIPGKMQLGAAWWFLDTRDGIEEQLKALGNLGLIGTFIGMLTDSRSFLSYTRHDYFRRIVCNVIGQWVEDGEYPDDDKSLKKIIQGICFNNANRYFGLNIQ